MNLFLAESNFLEKFLLLWLQNKKCNIYNKERKCFVFTQHVKGNHTKHADYKNECSNYNSSFLILVG